MAKKAKIVDIGLDIKLADGKAKKDAKPEQLNIPSPKVGKVLTVDKCIELSQEIESLGTELELLEADVKKAASDAKTTALANDTFVKTVNVEGTSHKLQIQFKDAYAKMDVAMEAPLSQIFGDKYSIMFTKTKNETLRTSKQAELKELLGTRFGDFFETEEFIKPSNEFQYNFFVMRKTLKPEQLATVQKVLGATQYNPSVKYPK